MTGSLIQATTTTSGINTCRSLVGTGVVNYYVEGGAAVLAADQTYDFTATNGTTPFTAFLFL